MVDESTVEKATEGEAAPKKRGRPAVAKTGGETPRKAGRPPGTPRETKGIVLKIPLADLLKIDSKEIRALIKRYL